MTLLRQKLVALAALTLGSLFAPIRTLALIPHSAPLASSQSALHQSPPTAVLTPYETAASAFCRNDPVNNADPLGLEIKLSGSAEEIAALERFRMALSAGSVSGEALMQRLDKPGFTVEYRFGTPPHSKEYDGEAVRGRDFGRRTVHRQLSPGSSVQMEMPLYNVVVYLNKERLDSGGGKIELDQAFGKFIHESVHAYDYVSAAYVEPESEWPMLTAILAPPDGVRTPYDVQMKGTVSGWFSLFQTTKPAFEYRAVRGLKGVRDEAGRLYLRASGMPEADGRALLTQGFRKDLAYFSLWAKIPKRSIETYLDTPLPERITSQMIVTRAERYTDIIYGTMELWYWWEH